jgi:hypothetical protein
MSWASWRETTRIEDLAYCLLGIFNINMPMLYGEGEGAFIRLQEEIVRKSDDHSIFAWTMPVSEAFPPSKGPPGLLATTPAAFRNSGNIVCSSTEFGGSASVAKGGIQLRLPLKQLREPDRDSFLAILNCENLRFPGQLLGIQLTRTPNTGDVFERDFSGQLQGIQLNRTLNTRDGFERGTDHLHFVRIDVAKVEELKRKTIYVKQEHQQITISKYNSYSVMGGLSERGISFRDSYGSPCHEGMNYIIEPYLHPGGEIFVAMTFESDGGVGFAVILMMTDGVVLAMVDTTTSAESAKDVFFSFGSGNGSYKLKRTWSGCDRAFWQHPSKELRVCVAARRKMEYSYGMGAPAKFWGIHISIS